MCICVSCPLIVYVSVCMCLPLYLYLYLCACQRLIFYLISLFVVGGGAFLLIRPNYAGLSRFAISLRALYFLHLSSISIKTKIILYFDFDFDFYLIKISALLIVYLLKLLSVFGLGFCLVFNVLLLAAHASLTYTQA